MNPLKTLDLSRWASRFVSAQPPYRSPPSTHFLDLLLSTKLTHRDSQTYWRFSFLFLCKVVGWFWALDYYTFTECTRFNQNLNHEGKFRARSPNLMLLHYYKLLLISTLDCKWAALSLPPSLAPHWPCNIYIFKQTVKVPKQTICYPPEFAWLKIFHI